ncbi:MAG: tetratricopeptide repeat protein [Kiritimatiellia bacterium]
MKLFASFICILSLVLSGTNSHAQAPVDPSSLFREGYKKYADGSFQEGLDDFTRALAALPKENVPFDPAMLHYNIGIGHFRLSQLDEAEAAFTESLRTPDLDLQARAYFNLGNVHYTTARQSLDNAEVAKGFQLFQSAATNFIQTMRLKPDDIDAKTNFELCRLAQQRILAMVTMAMQHVRQGEQLVGEYKFVEAAQWFQQNFEAMEQALSLEPEVKKQFEQMTQRSSSVADILAPSAPPPMPPGGSP